MTTLKEFIEWAYNDKTLVKIINSFNANSLSDIGAARFNLAMGGVIFPNDYDYLNLLLLYYYAVENHDDNG